MLIFWLSILAVAGWAGGPAGGAVVVALWVVVVYFPGKKRQEQEEARREARYFEDAQQAGEWDSVTTEVDFEEMTLTVSWYAPGQTEDRTYILERQGSGRWRKKLTPESQTKWLREMETEKNPFLREEDVQKVQRNRWCRLDPHFASRLEVAYQRYLKTL